MKVIEIQESFGLDNLRPAERPDPEVTPGGVLLRMKAATLNYRDLMMVTGQYNPRQPLPLIPCSDGVGEVVAIGDGVRSLAVGDRACPTFCQDWIAGEASNQALRSTLGGPIDGTLCELKLVPEHGLVKVPEHLSDEQAAALPCAALTAWSALVTHGNVSAGDTVVTLGTGGVSIFALQFAVLHGARVIVTSSSDEKLERAKALGAWETINYRQTEKWGKRVMELTDGRGADHVVEVGGAGTLQQSLNSVRPDGRVSVIGVLSGAVSDLNIIPVLMRNLVVRGIFVGHRESFEAMNRAIASHRLEPVIGESHALDDAAEAFGTMQQAGHFGKIALRIE